MLSKVKLLTVSKPTKNLFSGLITLQIFGKNVRGRDWKDTRPLILRGRATASALRAPIIDCALAVLAHYYNYGPGSVVHWYNCYAVGRLIDNPFSIGGSVGWLSVGRLSVGRLAVG
jgi:hypothetical protein